ncbi:transcriptional protein SWT1-like [Pseudomyrmex gracilis]|uniref:transcriptional protein SWT1-like n=1 Tax=Pseudomyrmex gracilis TaxID=219809 RepID=UPI000994C633|nr:transcriptional protein SWT1-like [Pseudomyrmex gracilis]
MIKQHLPDNWIVVNSKSYPDKIYYFNVKTSQSSWNQPTLEKSNKMYHYNKTLIASYLTKHSKLSNKQGKFSSKQKSHDKMVETSKSRALQEKMSSNTKVISKATSSSSSTSSSSTSSSSTSSSSSVTQSNTSSSVHSTSNKTQTYTPQMCALQEKIQKKNLNTSNRSSNTSNASLSSKSANTSSTSNPDRSKSIIKYKTQEERNTENKRRHYWNKNGKKEENYGLRKNLAKERMQMIRKHLGLDKKKCKEIGHVIVDKTPFQKSNTTASCDNNNFRSTYIYKNAEARLKKLRDRLMKETTYEKNTVLQNQKNQEKPEIMTSDKLIEQAKHEVLYEEMDWEPMKDEEITLEIEVARTQLCRENHKNTTDCISENTIEQATQSNNGAESSDKPPIYIVVDTNVFLTNLQIIEEARDAIFKNYSCSYIVIAWTVICELDYLKDSRRRLELNAKVRKAISFIHEQFSSKHPRVIGQTQEQAAKNKKKFAITCPDDDILQCCLQIQKLQKHVVLLSYDKNLCTKAMLHNMVIVERKDTLDKIDTIIKPDNETISQSNPSSSVINNNSYSSLFSEELRLADNIFVNIKAVMKDFLSTIISKQMSMIYGEAEWQTYVIIKPPWTIVTALKCAIKHWIAAVSEAFQRRAELCLKELLQAFEHAPDGGRKLEKLEYILEKCNDFVQLADTEKYGNLITETINTIIILKEKCRNYIAEINTKKLHEKIGFTDNIQEQEVRAARTFQCFENIYSYTCDFCGLACSIAGMPCMINFKPMDPPLSNTDVKNIRPEITRKVIDLTQNLNKLLTQAEKPVKYQTLVNLQQNLNTFLPDKYDRTKMPFDVELLDIYCCLRLKEDILKNGLRQLQELSDHFCALATRT